MREGLPLYPLSAVDITGWTVEAVTSDGHSPVPAPLTAPLNGALTGPLTGPLPAVVPGCIHLDLLAAGLVEDLAVRGTEADQAWVGRTGWRYRTTVPRPAQRFDRAVLRFEGIDTVAGISIDGDPRLDAENMFRTYELDVTEELTTREALALEVTFSPAVDVAQQREADNPLPRPAAYVLAYNQIRKMACSFGWDWGPTTSTAGLWKPVQLLSWSAARFADVAVRAVVGGGGPAIGVEAHVEFTAPDAGATTVEVVVLGPDGDILVKERTSVAAGHAGIDTAVPGARCWWPHGEGDQPLYTVQVRLLAADGTLLEEQVRSVGFRTVELVQTPDTDADQADAGSSFELHVNGRRVWVRGLNWIPDDIFPSRVSAERYRERLGDAVAAGANAVRVWGGGLYEAEAFYDACDELGLLVVQDFLFACAAYPEDPDTLAQVRAEVGDAVRRLRHRASLALWCGNNENLWGHEDWDWPSVLDGRPWGAGYYYEVLPELLAALDPDRPYVPGSPFSPDRSAHPNDPRSGMTHIWDVWNSRDYTDYETYSPRFVSEFGYQAPASWATLVEAGARFDPADPGLQAHQKADDGDAKLQAGLDRHFPRPPVGGPAWYVATQLLQARAVTTGITHLRSRHERCSGVIWWQLNDCWPAISWSVVDVRGRRKLAWHALRRAYDARLVALTVDRTVSLVNDTDQPWADQLVVRAASRATVSPVLEQSFTVPPFGQVQVDVPAHWFEHGDADVLVADVGQRRATRWLRGDLDLELGPQDADITVRAEGATVIVGVAARTLLRDVCLVAEIAVPDARVDGQLATLLPGETVELTLTAGVLTDERPDWADLVWSDNRLRTPRESIIDG